MQRVTISLKKVVVYLLAVSALIVFVWCSSNTQKAQNNAQVVQDPSTDWQDQWEDIRSVKIGVITTNTGTFAWLSDDIMHGLTTKVDAINAAWWIWWSEIILEERTGACSSQFGNNAARRFTELKDMDILLWAWCQEAIQAAATIAADNQVVLLDIGWWNLELAKQSPFLFNYRSNGSQATAIVDRLEANNTQSLWIIYAWVELSYSFAEDIMDQYSWEIVFLEKYTANDDGFESLRERIVPFINNFDAVVIVPQWVDDLEGLITVFDDNSSWNPIRRNVILANVTLDDDLIDRFGVRLEDVRWVVPVAFTPNENANTAQYVENYSPQVDPSLVVFGADTIGLVRDAVESNGPESEDIQAFLVATDQENPRVWYNRPVSFNRSWNGTGIWFDMVRIDDWAIRVDAE